MEMFAGFFASPPEYLRLIHQASGIIRFTDSNCKPIAYSHNRQIILTLAMVLRTMALFSVYPETRGFRIELSAVSLSFYYYRIFS
jgi:hypothetical protein